MNKQSSLEDMFSNLSKALKPLDDLMELAAYWEENKRYCKGDKVYLDKSMDSWTKDTNAYTHEITKSMGNLNNTKFEIHFRDLKTDEPYIVKIDELGINV